MALYREYGQSELDNEYSPSSAARASVETYVERYATLSQLAREKTDGWSTFRYGSQADEILDFLVPKGLGPWPLHVFIHGGNWQQSNQRHYNFLGPIFQRQEIAFISLNHTLAPNATIGQIIDQCRAAFIWLHAHCDELRLDRTRLTVSGHSAGAHLCAMLLATNWEVHGISDDFIKSGLLISGIFDLEPVRLSYVNIALHLTAQQAIEWSPQPSKIRTASRVKVVWGEYETSEFKRQSRTFAYSLSTSSMPHNAAEISGCDHFDILFEFFEKDSFLLQSAIRPLMCSSCGS
jgi:arylformamidase